jgi:entry exclusion lipoprotein TrbK
MRGTGCLLPVLVVLVVLVAMLLAGCANTTQELPVRNRHNCQNAVLFADRAAFAAQDEFSAGHFAAGMAYLRTVREPMLADAAEACATPEGEQP